VKIKKYVRVKSLISHFSLKMSHKKSIPIVKNFKIKPILFWGIAILIILVGFSFRFLSFNNVVTDNTVQLKGADAYFFAKQAVAIKTNGFLPKSDPLICFPEGFQYDQSAGLYSTVLAFMSNFMPVEFATAVSSPVFAGLLFVVMLFLLREIFKKNDYAVLGGLLVVSLTGIQFISRSYFGFGDRHVLEALLFTFGLFCFIKAISKESYIWTAISGVGFALYNYSWGQSSMMILILIVGIIMSILLKTTLKKKFLPLTFFILVVQAIPALMFGNMQLLGIVIAGVLAILLAYILRIKISKRNLRLGIFIGAFALLVVGVYLLFPKFYDRMFYIIDGFINPKGTGPSVSEAAPMFTIYSQIGFLDTVFLQLLFMFSGLVGMFYAFKKQNFIIFVCGICLFGLTLIRIRSEYYYLMFSSLGVAYIIRRFPKMFYVITAAVILFFMQYVSAWSSDLRNQNSSLAFTNADYKMANWMKVNLPSVTISDNNQANYGILADWSLGYLYTYIADKPMYAEPNFCNYIEPSRLFLWGDESVAYQYMKKNNLKYILLKPLDLNRFYYYLTQWGMTDRMMAVSATVDGEKKTFINQNYYGIMAVKLYNFNGLAYVPTQVYTITADKKLLDFPSYESALETGAFDFFSLDVYKSPIPIPPLQHFKLIHNEQDSKGGVKLFEVVD